MRTNGEDDRYIEQIIKEWKKKDQKGTKKEEIRKNERKGRS